MNRSALPLVALLATLLLAPCPSSAHDPRQPDLDGWYSGLLNQYGGSCCSRQDCKVVSYGPDSRSDAWIDAKRGVWEVRISPRYFGPDADNQVYDAPPVKYAKQYGPEGTRHVATNMTDGFVVCWSPTLGLLCVIPPLEF
jgi:hypothetical protein